MIHMNEALIVEGRYDKSKLSALTDAIIVTTNGFGIYKDAEKRDFIRKLAKERGIVILTDSDNAGRQIPRVYHVFRAVKSNSPRVYPGYLRQRKAQSGAFQRRQARRGGHFLGNFTGNFKRSRRFR